MLALLAKELIIQILSFSNVLDLGCISSSCRRLCYLVGIFQDRMLELPEVSTASCDASIGIHLREKKLKTESQISDEVVLATACVPARGTDKSRAKRISCCDTTDSPQNNTSTQSTSRNPSHDNHCILPIEGKFLRQSDAISFSQSMGYAPDMVHQGKAKKARNHDVRGRHHAFSQTRSTLPDHPSSSLGVSRLNEPLSGVVGEKSAPIRSDSSMEHRAIRSTIERLRSTPSLALTVRSYSCTPTTATGEERTNRWMDHTVEETTEQSFLRAVDSTLPPETMMIGSLTSRMEMGCLFSGQCNTRPPPNMKLTNLQEEPTEEDATSHPQDFGVMLISLPKHRTTLFPFRVTSSTVEGPSRYTLENLLRSLRDSTPQGEDHLSFWKLFIVYGGGNMAAHADVEKCVAALQGAYPYTTIVGGLCDIGYLSLPRESTRAPTTAKTCNKSTRKTVRVQKGVFGVGIGGEFCFEAVLTRGEKPVTSGSNRRPGNNLLWPSRVANGVPSWVRSMRRASLRSGADGEMTSQDNPPPAHSGQWTVSSSRLLQPGHHHYPLRTLGGMQFSSSWGERDAWKPMHIIDSVRNSFTGEQISALELYRRTCANSGGAPNFTGLRRLDEDAYFLEFLGQKAAFNHPLYLSTDGSTESEQSIVGSHIDFFRIDGNACLEDLAATLQSLRDRQTKSKDEAIGAILFASFARGPMSRGLLASDMMDANEFLRYFPHVPCLGLSTESEIGPRARTVLLGTSDFSCSRTFAKSPMLDRKDSKVPDRVGTKSEQVDDHKHGGKLQDIERQGALKRDDHRTIDERKLTNNTSLVQPEGRSALQSLAAVFLIFLKETKERYESDGYSIRLSDSSESIDLYLTDRFHRRHAG